MAGGREVREKKLRKKTGGRRQQKNKAVPGFCLRSYSKEYLGQKIRERRGWQKHYVSSIARIRESKKEAR